MKRRGSEEQWKKVYLRFERRSQLEPLPVLSFPFVDYDHMAFVDDERRGWIRMKIWISKKVSFTRFWGYPGSWKNHANNRGKLESARTLGRQTSCSCTRGPLKGPWISPPEYPTLGMGPLVTFLVLGLLGTWRDYITRLILVVVDSRLMSIVLSVLK